MNKCNWPRCICKATGNYCSAKPKSGPKEKKPIKKVSSKRKEKLMDMKIMHKNDAAFYLEIWQERQHIDYEDQKTEITSFSILHFHHVLEKRNYPEYRHCKWNIVLLTWQHHDQVTLNIDKLPRVKAYTEKLKALHDAGKLKNINPNQHSL
jgi:hypothetical protein